MLRNDDIKGATIIEKNMLPYGEGSIFYGEHILYFKRSQHILSFKS